MKYKILKPLLNKGLYKSVETARKKRAVKNTGVKSACLLMACCLLAAGCNNSGKIKKSWEETEFAADGKSTGDTLDIMDSTAVLDSLAAVRPGEPIIYEAVSAQSFPVIKLNKTISSDAQSIHVILTDVEPGQFTVSISHSREDANIRISQIIMPDGTSDGPFGRQLNFYAPQKGNYTIIIGKSNMASGSPVGDVFIKIEK